MPCFGRDWNYVPPPGNHFGNTLKLCGNFCEAVECLAALDEGRRVRRLWAMSVEFCPGILAGGGEKNSPGLCQEGPVRIAGIWDELFHGQIKQPTILCEELQESLWLRSARLWRAAGAPQEQELLLELHFGVLVVPRQSWDQNWGGAGVTQTI